MFSFPVGSYFKITYANKIAILYINNFIFQIFKNVARMIRTFAFNCSPSHQKETMQQQDTYISQRKADPNFEILASGDSQQSLSFAFRLGKATVSKAIFKNNRSNLDCPEK